MKILIGADMVSTRSNREAFVRRDVQCLLGDALCRIMAEADYRIVNLEAPLTDHRSPIKKCGPCMAIPQAAAVGYREMGVDLVTIANNHIMDQDTQGLSATLETLKEQGIAWVGAGNDLHEAAKPFILEKDGFKVGIYACAEHEFSIAGDATPGANPFDPLWSLDHIQALKEQCDHVIVLYHGGKEEYRLPSPNLQKVCRRIADKGADLVVCQHSHCVGCEENWNGSTIVYGQGNFLFDLGDEEPYQTGMLVELELSAQEKKVRYIPLERNGAYIRLAEGAAGAKILEGFSERSARILEPGYVEEAYSRYAQGSSLEYYGRSLGRLRYILFRIVNMVFGGKLKDKCYTEKDALMLMNTLDCESHRELYIRILSGRTRA